MGPFPNPLVRSIPGNPRHPRPVVNDGEPGPHSPRTQNGRGETRAVLRSLVLTVGS